jgi:hypothetical protein
MPYLRKIIPIIENTTEQLNHAMAGIGMNILSMPDYEANIEDTIYYSSEDGMDRNDFRVLSVLTMWLSKYSRWVNVDRITRVVLEKESERVRAYWCSIGHWKKADPRFALLETKLFSKGKTFDLLPSGTEFLMMRNGEDDRFKGSMLRVPNKSLRQRESDVFEPWEMQTDNLFIRYRMIIGPTYRADMWATLNLHPDISIAELARRTYGSYPTAWNVKKDWEYANGRSHKKAG